MSHSNRSTVLVLALMFAFGARLAAADPPAPIDPTSAVGAAIYQKICQGCHMPAAQGAVGAGHYPKLAGDRALASWEYVATTVLQGRNGMPSFGARASREEIFGGATLSDLEIADVVNYVRSHFGNKYKDKVTESQVAGLRHPGSPLHPTSTVTH